MELPARSGLHQNGCGVEACQAEERKNDEQGNTHQQSGGLRAIPRVPTLSKTTNSDFSDVNKVPPRSEVQQVRGHRMGGKVSVSSLLVPSLSGIYSLAERILGSNPIWSQPSRI